MARVGTRGAGLSKDIALSVKNKLTHLGANVSDDLARLSGKVEDAFAYADGAVSKNIGKHNARVYQSNGGNWDEVASGILGGSGAGRKAAAEFSDDASQALAKHGDEVSQALKETGEQSGKRASAEFGGETSSLDGELLRSYIKDVKINTNRNITKNQLEKLKTALRENEYSKLEPRDVAKHRSEFNGVKNRLIKEWEENTGQNWPKYTEDVIGKNGNVVRKAGSKYDAHHIIENSYGGNNEWWNIHPARFPNEHQAGIHRSGSPANKLFK